MAKIMALATFTCFTGAAMVVFNKGEVDPETGKPIYREIPDALAQGYIDAGLAEAEKAEAVQLASLTKAQLVELAKNEEITIDPSKTKAEIITVIETARAEALKSAGEGDGEGDPPA